MIRTDQVQKTQNVVKSSKKNGKLCHYTVPLGCLCFVFVSRGLEPEHVLKLGSTVRASAPGGVAHLETVWYHMSCGTDLPIVGTSDQCLMHKVLYTTQHRRIRAAYVSHTPDRNKPCVLVRIV